MCVHNICKHNTTRVPNVHQQSHQKNNLQLTRHRMHTLYLQGSIPDGKWQAAGRCAALQAPASLTRYSVKERLISRWREVHADEQGHAHENGAANGSAAAGSGKDTTGTGPNGAKAEAAPARKRPGKKAPGQEEEGAGPLPGAPAAGDFADDVQRALFAALHSYSDVVVPCRAYPTSMEDPGACSSLRSMHGNMCTIACLTWVWAIGQANDSYSLHAHNLAASLRLASAWGCQLNLSTPAAAASPASWLDQSPVVVQVHLHTCAFNAFGYACPLPQTRTLTPTCYTP